MSWVTNTTVLLISICRRRNSFCSRSRLIGSIAPNGSSISMSGGSAAERPRHAHSLVLAARELARVAVAHTAGRAHELEQLVDAGADPALSQPSSRGTVAMFVPIV